MNLCAVLDNLTRSEMFRAMIKAPSKLEQIKAMRVANAMRLEGAKALRRKSPVTETLRAIVATVTKMGRPRKADKLSPAEKQRAYRQRLKANG